MTKKIILLLSLMGLTFCFAQTQQKDTSKAKSPLIKQIKTPVKSDTTIQVLKDTFTLDATNSDVRVLIVKDDDDWFLKYIFPLITLILGISIPLVLEYFFNKRKLSKVGSRWVAELLFLRTPITEQIQELKKFIIAHKEDKFAIPDLYLIEGTNCEIFNSLDKSELLKFLEKRNSRQNSIEISNKIHGFINTVKSNTLAFNEKFKDFLAGTSQYTSDLTKNLNGLSRSFNNYGVLLEQELLADPINDPRYKPILDLFNKEIYPYRDNGDYDAFKLEEDFFIPLLAFFCHIRFDPRINDMMMYLTNCIDAIKGIKMEKVYVKENFEIVISRYEEQLKELPEMISYVS